MDQCFREYKENGCNDQVVYGFWVHGGILFRVLKCLMVVFLLTIFDYNWVKSSSA
jgi:hypothetical protein